MEEKANVLELQRLDSPDDPDEECFSIISGCFSFKSSVE